MLSKCANPACSEQFRFLREGKLFHMTPTPEVQAIGADDCPALYERFWLCDRCSMEMTLVWDGTHAKVVPLAAEPPAMPAFLTAQVVPGEYPRRRAAQAASRNR